MKKTLLIISSLFGLLLVSNAIKAQAPGWTWAKQIADTSDNEGQGIATDSLGNVYVVGNFSGNTVTIGASTLANVSPGNEDSYIVKYDAAGNVLWIKGIGGPGNEIAGGIATDKSGNIYVGGSFDSPSLNLGSTTLTNTGSEDIFLAKYNTSGNLIWAKSASGNGGEGIWRLCADGSGNVFVTGRYADTALTIGSFALPYVGAYNGGDIFTAKFDSNGNVIWAKGAGGTGSFSSFGADYPGGISTDGSGDVYVTASYSSATFTFGTTVLNNGGFNAMLFKYDASGNPLWAKSTGGTGNWAGGVTVDAAGNAYMTGYTNSSPFTVGAATVTTAGASDMFIVKFDAAGNVVWAKCAGGSALDFGQAIAMDPAGNVYVTGSFTSLSASFGSAILTGTGNGDVFVAKYDASGNALWAAAAPANKALCSGVCIEPGGGVYVTGYYSDSTATFGSTTLANAGKEDAFVAKLSGSVLGIKENHLYNSAFIYPNPSATEATVKFDRNMNDATIRIYNANGKIVREISDFNGLRYVLLRETLEAGMYFLQVVCEDRIISSGKITITD